MRHLLENSCTKLNFCIFSLYLSVIDFDLTQAENRSLLRESVWFGLIFFRLVFLLKLKRREGNCTVKVFWASDYAKVCVTTYFPNDKLKWKSSFNFSFVTLCCMLALPSQDERNAYNLFIPNERSDWIQIFQNKWFDRTNLIRFDPLWVEPDYLENTSFSRTLMGNLELLMCWSNELWRTPDPARKNGQSWWLK